MFGETARGRAGVRSGFQVVFTMFLFTSTPQAQPSPQTDHPLARPLAQAAQETGVPFDYLVKTAKRESNLNPEAKASSSSATGLFQFIEQTWLGLVKRQGAQMGLEDAASAISRDSSGRYSVSDASTKQQILALRKDPTLSAKLAGVFTAENRESLKGSLGRDPTGGELYIAHFMGASGARELISQAANTPDKSAAASFPDAASANRPIFFDGKGRARSLREVYARLVSFHEGEGAAQVAAVTPPAQMAGAQGAGGQDSARSPLAIAAARGAAAQHSGFFRSGGNADSAAQLRKTWIGVAESRVNRNAPSFFPRESSGSGVQVASLDKAVPTGVLAKFEAQEPYKAAPFEAVDLPTPPKRPEGLGQPGVAQQNRSPLDLTRYVTQRR
jgi:Transglycosylase SLT domain